MLIVIALTVVMVAGLIVVATVDEWSDWHMVGFFAAFMGGACLFAAGVLLLLIPLSIHGQIQRVEATRATYEASREAGLSLENAAIQADVADVNRWLAGQRYWNGTLFGLWIPDEIESVEPIR